MKRPMRFLTIGVFFCLLSLPFYGQDCVTGYCPKTVTAHHEASYVAPLDATITYPVVETNLTGTNMCWIAQNLGATTQAASLTDGSDAAAGWYWQFNRKQGYAINTNGTPTVYTDDTYTPVDKWIYPNFSEDSDWQPENDPCTLLLGTGWRLPSQQEWINIDTNENGGSGWTDNTLAYNSVFKFHMAGMLTYSKSYPFLGGRTTTTRYWTSDQSAPLYGSYYWLDAANARSSDEQKISGYSVRCLRAL